VKINEAAGLLGLSREQTIELIVSGLNLPKSGQVQRLKADQAGTDYDITDEQLDVFLAAFEAEELGRWPPVAVRRSLLVESSHRCAVCHHATFLQFHHMIEFGKIGHHDPRHMLAVCGTCHDLCSKGFIDYVAQQEYKRRLEQPLWRAGVGDEAQWRKSDLQTLKTLLSTVPTDLLQRFVDLAESDRIPGEILVFWETFQGTVNSLMFHIYDQQLDEAVRRFYHAFDHSLSFGHCFARVSNARFVFVFIWPDPSCGGDATIQREEEHNRFHQSVGAMAIAFKELYDIVRRKYPEIDFVATDCAAWDAHRSYLKE
jgi:hypothetical protein